MKVSTYLIIVGPHAFISMSSAFHRSSSDVHYILTFIRSAFTVGTETVQITLLGRTPVSSP